MGNRLLLADDSITIQKVVGIIFANEDYELTVVDNGNAALEKAREILPDIILVDALMPGKTGYEVCETVRRDPAMKHIPLLLLTGAFEPFDEEKARRSGADDYISKPFESQHLIDKVKRLIELGRERAESIPGYEADVDVFPSAAPPPPPVTTGISEPLGGAIPFAPFVGEPAGTFFCSEESLGEEPRETPVPFAEEVVEATPEDDLWGVFELDEVSEGVEPGNAVEEGMAGPVAGTEAVEAFSFGEDQRAGLPGSDAGSAGAESSEFGVKWEPVEEETFIFQEEDASGEFPAVETTQVQAAACFAAAEPAAALSVVAEGEQLAVPSMGEADLQFAPGEEYVPVTAAVSSAVAPPASPAGEPTMSEERLAAIISQISKDIIEKIVWEVVPDLAETLIKEEIRKLKEGS